MNPQIAASAGIGTFLAIAIFGLMVARWISSTHGWAGSLPYAYPLGAGLYTWTLFLFGWGGTRISLPTAFVLLVVLTVMAVILVVRRSMARSSVGTPPHSTIQHVQPLPAALAVGTIVALWAWTSWIAIGRAYWQWDAAAIWASKGYGIALQQTVFTSWGEHGLAYPLNLPLQISIHHLLGTEALPAGILTYPLYLASALGGLLAFWQRRQVRPVVAAVGLALIGTVPVVFQYALNGYSDLPLATYLLLGALCSAEAVHTNDKQTRILGGVLLGLAAWTRAEGILYAMAVLGVCFVAMLLAGKPIRQLLWIGLPLTLIATPWLVFFRLYGAQSSQSQLAWQRLLDAALAGRIDWRNVRLLLGFTRRHLFDTTIWGTYFYASFALLVLNWRRLLAMRNNIAATLVLIAGSLGMVTMFLYFGISFVVPDFLAQMQQSLGRALLPAAMVTGAAAIGASTPPSHSVASDFASFNFRNGD